MIASTSTLTDRGWEQIDDEARKQLVAALAARKLVDFSGPHGWERSATSLGRTEAMESAPVEGVTALRRRVLPLIEPRADFSLSRAELEDAARGAEAIELGPLGEAARRIALVENTAVFHGWEGAGIEGISAASPHAPIHLSGDMEACPTHVAGAVEMLLGSGVGGPYGLALGPAVYRQVIETTEHGGYPLFEHLRHITGGPLVWAPGVDGGVVLSMRGGDFLFECGQDLAIAYDRHDADAVQLYFVESFSFRVATPEAAVALPASPAG